MRKRMEALEVRVDEQDGTVVIHQDSMQESTLIVLSPDQIDTLIQWLAEAKQEAQEIYNAAASAS